MARRRNKVDERQEVFFDVAVLRDRDAGAKDKAESANKHKGPMISRRDETPMGLTMTCAHCGKDVQVQKNGRKIYSHVTKTSVVVFEGKKK